MKWEIAIQTKKCVLGQKTTFTIPKDASIQNGTIQIVAYGGNSQYGVIAINDYEPGPDDIQIGRLEVMNDKVIGDTQVVTPYLLKVSTYTCSNL
ncbi:unnamed protein product [Dibothriocephalus latus]|uniref:Uncharacterized protein n=1 Tax=Dibothriocephalus latus TaxID=60516 RepID=A0A3P6P9E9_DIBLA|nr:unnamed protein product [Dibothriocephalus latus]